MFLVVNYPKWSPSQRLFAMNLFKMNMKKGRKLKEKTNICYPIFQAKTGDGQKNINFRVKMFPRCSVVFLNSKKVNLPSWRLGGCHQRPLKDYQGDGVMRVFLA